MNQKIVEGVDIFHEIILELEKANTEILVASAWFTDPDLFNTLLRKQKNGVSVRLIIADNESNQKINFSLIEKEGGIVYKAKNKGYGMMHKKYCVIDEKLAIHGSYNWTLNAKRNNQESVIITDHQETIIELHKSFIHMEMELQGQKLTDKPKKTFGFKNTIMKIFNKSKKNMDNADTLKQRTDEVLIENDLNHSNSTSQNIDYEFKNIVSAEIKNIDRSEIRDLGKESAGKVNGDEGVLLNSMDSLFQIFISDVNQVEEKKKMLKSKIDSKKEELSSNYELDKNNNKQIEEKGYSVKTSDYKDQILNQEGKKKLKISTIEFIKNTTIPDFIQKTENIKKSITDLQVEFVKPKIKWFELIPMLLILLGLGTSLFLFYSSSAYIMLYAKEDAIEALKNGIIPIAQVFNSNAMKYAGFKGGTAVFYLSVFVFIPLAVAFVSHKSKIIGKIFGYASIVLMDIFVAFKVSEAIKDIRYLSDGTKIDEPFYMDINFILVFFLSAIPFVFFTILLNKTLEIFESRHPQSGKEKADFQIKNFKINIKEIEEQIKESKNKKQLVKDEIITIENSINDLKANLKNLEIEHPKSLNAIEESFNDKIRALKRKADLYKNNIDNDNIPISVSALKDRVSVFLEGWNEWLHGQFSVNRAKTHSENARKTAEIWLSNNIKSNKSINNLKKAISNEKDYNFSTNGNAVSILQ